MRDYEPDVSQILALYQQLEDDIISSMTKRMLKMGKVSESTKYEAVILQSAGLLYEDILDLIAQRTNTTKQHVKALFEDAGVQTVEIDNQIHTESGAVPIDIRQDLGMRRILEAGYKKTLKTMRNLVNTTANMVQTAFISSCDRAYMQVSSGAFSYQQAIRQAVKSFADIGATVKYPSGHTDKLDVAVRRAVLTGVGQTSAMVAMERAKQAGCYLMELTAHSGSRPEHAVWQGQLVSLTGKDVGKTIDGLHVFSLEQIGYQTGAGFKGWNCRHNWHPYYVGYSIPNYTKEQLAELDAKNIEYNGKMYSEYEISQMQRAKERKVRALKRQVIASQTALENAPDDMTKSELQADYSKNAVKLKSAEKQLREFCKQTGRRNDTFRTQVDGFGRSQAQKAVWSAKKSQKDLTSIAKKVIINGRRSGTGNSNGEHYYELIGEIDYHDKKAVVRSLKEFEVKYQDSDIEHCRVITVSGKVYEVHGNRWAVDTSILGDELKGSINEHNHVTGESQYSFSWEDLESCIYDGSKMALAYDEKYRYFTQFPDKIISEDDLYDAYEASKEEVANARIFKTEIITDEDYQHEVVKRTCEKVGILYGRNRK